MAIALRKVSFSYGDRPVLDKVSLRFPEKGVICLFGASGCGKDHHPAAARGFGTAGQREP